MKSLDIEANFVGILPPSLDALRHRIKQNTKLNTEKINAELEKASDEIKEIEKYVKVVFQQRTPGISSTQIKQYLTDNTKYSTFVIDVDDTICYTYYRDFKNSEPNTKVINKINELYDKGWKIILFTARGDKSCNTLEEKELKYREITEEWLKNNNVKYHKLMFGKPNADYYVDDKNISIDEFLKFESGDF